MEQEKRLYLWQLNLRYMAIIALDTKTPGNDI